MADWSVIRAVLKAWVTSITGLTPYWSNRPKPRHFGDAYALLGITGRRTVGNDAVISEYDATQAAGSQIRRYQAGSRQFTFWTQVRTSRQSDDNDAMHYTSMIANSTCLPALTESKFKGADISFARILGETDLDARIDNRDMSVAQIDLLINASNIQEDTATGWIKTLKDFEFYDVDNPAPPLWTGDIDVETAP